MEKGRFVGYLVAGSPNREESISMMQRYCEAGIDILEIGFPSSAPSMDGSVIRRAQERADATICEDMAYWRALRRAITVPIWLMGYGRDLVDTGICRRLAKERLFDVLVIPDISAQARVRLRDELLPFGVEVIGFTTPESTPEELACCFENMKVIYQQLYCGQTGISHNDRNYEGLLRRTRESCDAQVYAGFGISTAQRAKELLQSGFDGIIIGSAILAKAEESEQSALDFIREMHQAVLEVDE
ncbi:MAG: tryptophan synthase subunit alpha [Aristaeellaceae bacterium]